MIALEQLTNPRVRDEVGEISLVPAAQRVTGPGASYVMASFTHINPKGSRFSDGSFGVYYAASALETAIAETVFHFEVFARDSNDPPRMEKKDKPFDFQVYLGTAGLGKGTFATLDYSHTDAKGNTTNVVPIEVYPVAEVEFPSKASGGPPIRTRWTLKQRC